MPLIIIRFGYFWSGEYTNASPAESEDVQNLLPHQERERAQGGYANWMETILTLRELKGSPCINTLNSFESDFQIVWLCSLIALSD